MKTVFSASQVAFIGGCAMATGLALGAFAVPADVPTPPAVDSTRDPSSTYRDSLRAACDAWFATTGGMEPVSDEVLSIYSACLNFEEAAE